MNDKEKKELFLFEICKYDTPEYIVGIMYAIGIIKNFLPLCSKNFLELYISELELEEGYPNPELIIENIITREQAMYILNQQSSETLCNILEAFKN
jgi:hypothetical protein